MFESLFARDDDHQGVLRRRYDPSLLLPAKARVNIAPSIVNASNLKSPSHLVPPVFFQRLLVSERTILPPHLSRRFSSIFGTL
jgi:hypothetical protein